MRAGFMMRLQGEENKQFRMSALDRRHLSLLLAHLRPQAVGLAVAVIAIMLTSGITLAFPYLLKVAVDRHIAESDMTGLIIVAVIYFGLTLVQWFASFSQAMLCGRIGQNVVQALRRDLYESVLRNSLSFFRKQRIGEVMSRLTNDVNSLSEFVSTGVIHVINDVFTLCGILVMMFVLDVRLALVTCISIPVIALGTQYIGRKMRESSVALRQEIAAVNIGVQQGVSGMRVTQSLGREQIGIEQFEGLSLRNMKANLKASFFFALLFPLMSVSNMLSIILVLTYGGSLVSRGAITVGTLLGFFGYVNSFFGPVREMTLVYNSLQSAAASLQRVGEYLSAEPDVKPPDSPVRLGQNVEGTVMVEHVTFKYPRGANEGPQPQADRTAAQDRDTVLHDIHFRVEPGSVVAFVGPTGAGKTTLALLLARLYDPDEGRILIDGVDLRLMEFSDLRRIVSLVPQDVYLFPVTIGENIRYGRLDATEEEVREAARVAQANAFIEQLPLGYDTPVGEGGARLSGGQKQLVSLARTVLGDPRILILDEPTANVDVITESLIQQGLRELVSGRTTFVIAHRFSTVKEADRIVLLEHGTVSGIGSHVELMSSSESYRTLYEKQWARNSKGRIDEDTRAE